MNIHHARHQKMPRQQTWGPRSSGPPTPPLPPAWTAPPQGPAPGKSSDASAGEPPPEKRRRVFLWFFLGVQILFVIWVISGIASGSGTPDSCQGMTGDALKTCKDVSHVGTTIGVGLIVGFWVAADFILGITYVLYRLATRRPGS